MECRKKTAFHFFLVQKNCSPESQDKGVLPEAVRRRTQKQANRKCVLPKGRGVFEKLAVLKKIFRRCWQIPSFYGIILKIKLKESYHYAAVDG